MAATISQVNAGITARLATISGLRAFDYQPDNAYPPYAFPSLSNIEYHKAMAGGAQIYTYNVTVVTGRVDDRSAQDELDGYASYDGAKSVRAAIEADRTLGGVVDTLLLSNSANVSAMSIGDNNYIVLDFTLTVYG